MFWKRNKIKTDLKVDLTMTGYKNNMDIQKKLAYVLIIKSNFIIRAQCYVIKTLF